MLSSAISTTTLPRLFWDASPVASNSQLTRPTVFSTPATSTGGERIRYSRGRRRGRHHTQCGPQSRTEPTRHDGCHLDPYRIRGSTDIRRGDCHLLLTGSVRAGGLVVIEGTPSRYALRHANDGSVCVTNRYHTLTQASQTHTPSCSRHFAIALNEGGADICKSTEPFRALLPIPQRSQSLEEHDRSAERLSARHRRTLDQSSRFDSGVCKRFPVSSQ